MIHEMRMNAKDDLDSIVYAERIDTIKVFLDNHGWIYNVDKAGTKIRYRVLSFGEKSKEKNRQKSRCNATTFSSKSMTYHEPGVKG